jgi:uncharacterized OsmC-like protein
MAPITVSHLGADRFAIRVRGHVLTVDQPVGDGGTDAAPTPTELFIAALASCVAFYARRYLTRHDLPTHGLAVEAEYSLAPHPTRVAEVSIALTVPEGVPPERHQAMLAMASHCTVHNTIEMPPEVAITLHPSSSSAYLSSSNMGDA